jgi:hypothetical protein
MPPASAHVDAESFNTIGSCNFTMTNYVSGGYTYGSIANSSSGCTRVRTKLSWNNTGTWYETSNDVDLTGPSFYAVKSLLGDAHNPAHYLITRSMGNGGNANGWGAQVINSYHVN